MIAAGLYPHLMQVEFPYAEANARMEWDGVPVSRERLTQLLGGLGRGVDLHRGVLNDAGVALLRRCDTCDRLCGPLVRRVQDRDGPRGVPGPRGWAGAAGWRGAASDALRSLRTEREIPLKQGRC